MKNASTIISIAAAAIAAAALVLTLVKPCPDKSAAVEGNPVTAAAGDIVYIQLDKIVMSYDMYNDLIGELDAKKQTIENDINKKGRKLESDMKSFENQINKGLLTRSAAEKQQQALLERQQELQNLAQQKQNEILEENNVMMNRVMDAIRTYLVSFNADHQFAAILSTTDATNVIMVGSPALDITDAVLEGLNAEYVKNRNN